MTAFDVFISYCQRDKAIVRQVVSDLEEAGLTVWQDKQDLLPGERFRESINNALGNSRVVVVFISQRALNSRWVLDELDMAMLREKREHRTVVFPLLIGRIKPETNQFPEDLRGKHYIDLRYDFDKKYDLLRDYLITAIRASCNRGYKGQPLVKTILAYEFTGKNEKLALPSDVVSIMADELGFKGLRIFDQWYSGGLKEARKVRRDFVREWGRHAIRKMFLFAWEALGFSFSRGFTDRDLLKTMEATAVLVHCFEV